MKNNIEVFNKISNLQFLDMINSIEEIDVNNLVNLSLEVNELSSSLDFESINKQLFKYNNLLNKSKKEYDLDVKSFNLGVIATFLKTLTFIERSNKTNNLEKTFNSLNALQQSIIDIIYMNEGIDSKRLRENLKITSQYLYNLTHTPKLNNLINIYSNEKDKNKYYSLTASCRKYLDKQKKIKKVNVSIVCESFNKKEFYDSKIEYFIRDKEKGEKIWNFKNYLIQ